MIRDRPRRARLDRVDGGSVARLGETGDVIDLDYPLFLVDRVEDAVPSGPQDRASPLPQIILIYVHSSRHFIPEEQRGLHV